tara:strand:- start:149 stop:460 length:312 start_codon:yes stop_codon:yes gene_type:complete
MTKIIFLPIATQSLQLIEQDGVRYVSLDALAQLLDHPSCARTRLDILLGRSEGAMTGGSVRQIAKESGGSVRALTIRAAIIMLARSRARDTLALHDILVQQIG